MVQPFSKKVGIFFTDLGQGLSQKDAFFLTLSQFYEPAF